MCALISVRIGGHVLGHAHPWLCHWFCHYFEITGIVHSNLQVLGDLNIAMLNVLHFPTAEFAVIILGWDMITSVFSMDLFSVNCILQSTSLWGAV